MLTRSHTHRHLHSFPTRRSSDLGKIYELTGPELLSFQEMVDKLSAFTGAPLVYVDVPEAAALEGMLSARSEEHTSELQSLTNLVCRLLLEKKKKKTK